MSNVVALTDSTASPAERLGAEITALCSVLYAAEYRLLRLIREFDEHEYYVDRGFHSTAHWLNFHCGVGMNAAREKLRVARALAELPKIAAAFERGRLSYSKVRAMTRVADAENEDYLLRIATHGTAYHVEKLVAKYRTAKRLRESDAEESSDTASSGRELAYYYDHDGFLVLRARLPADQGALVVKALEKALDDRFAAQPDDVTAETSDADAAREPVAARKADALADLAESYLANDQTVGSAGDRYQVVLHVTAETSHLEDGPGVTAETSRRIGCDCSRVRVHENETGEPLSIGRKRRSIPPAIRRALKLRDGGCRFPGCTHTRFVDGHHIRHWADGGETRLDNLVLLCRHHHRLVHEGGFRCEKTASGEIVFRDRRDQDLPASMPLPGLNPDALQAWLDREFFEADDGTGYGPCAAQWYAGDRMDWQMAISAMFPR
jgi:5-methylcytosine-specific restriction endonuclease McrA